MSVRRRPNFGRLLAVPWRARGDARNWSVVADIPAGNGREVTMIMYSLGRDAREICSYVAAVHNKNLQIKEELT